MVYSVYYCHFEFGIRVYKSLELVEVKDEFLFVVSMSWDAKWVAVLWLGSGMKQGFTDKN